MEKKNVSVLGKKWCSPPPRLSSSPSAPAPTPPSSSSILNDFQVCPWVKLLAPILGMLGVCLHKHETKLGGGTWCKYNIRGENNCFEVLRMKSVKIILDEDRPIYIPRKENVWHKRLPWTAWVLVNTFQPCDWKPKACDPQQRPRPEIILWEHCVCLQMVLDCFSWMPHFPKARSCFRESLKFGKVLYSKSKVLSSQENA